MSIMDRQKIKMSDIPLEVLYNEKIEFIRISEYAQMQPPLPITFNIQDSFADGPEIKKISFTCESAPKTYSLKLDINKRVLCFESNAEMEERKR